MIKNLFLNAERVPILSWRSIFEGTRRLKGLCLRASLIVSLRLHKETGLAAVAFARVVFRLVRKSGLLFTSLYLKQCGVSLQRYYAGSYSKQDSLSVPVSLTRTGLPKIIPVYIRRVIRKNDDRADKWVRTYLSWFSASRLVELAPSVTSSTFASIHEPIKDIGSVKEVLSVLKMRGRRLVSTYLPFARSIPVYQGLKWEPTWKSTPMTTKFVSRYRSLTPEELSTLDDTNIFSNLKHELASFMYNINKIHSLPEGFFSPGCLWPEWIIYPFDFKRTTEIANWSLEWFERRIGPHMSSIVSAYQIHPPVPLFTGKLAQTLPGAGKRRIFAICNYVKQMLLKPIHSWAMKILSSIPMDGTFNQVAPLLRLAKIKRTHVYSFDLKSATDRWPLPIIYTCVASFFGETYASSVVNSTLGLNTFRVDKPIVSRMSEIAFRCGQPLGYYGSWSLFALSHHLVVWLAADLAYPSRETPFRDYAVLGDDVLIADTNVALEYKSLLSRLGVSISESKSIISETGAIEFAKKYWVKGMQVDLSPVSLKSLLGARHTIGLCQIGAKYDLDFNTLLRIGGAGYRVRSRQLSTLNRKWEKIRAVQVKLTGQRAQLPIEFWIGRGCPLDPYLKGKIIVYLRKEFKPKELRLTPEGLLFDGEVEIAERTVIHNWMKQWLKWIYWYYSVAMSPDVKLDQFFDAPICATSWKRNQIDLNLKRFSALWRCYDMAVGWPKNYPWVLPATTVLKIDELIKGGFSGTDFLMKPVELIVQQNKGRKYI
ncbi:RNA dependent RNA polymerase [Chenopodium quinoa mitovirus 1]|uniref:RNA dependent RNA polymerase n=1 Tax=Chenopodium quinoa mitovirus 1 TaxID=2185087 RepID=A0A2U8LM99_9VIRU|nr:RNA dependent RNA polymerase [Chenopodium quinoa mitovirus 1]AWL21855.1 RNA dependent RNA polymerase [Chenopodium quinoa mitovirus 1]